MAQCETLKDAFEKYVRLGLGPCLALRVDQCQDCGHSAIAMGKMCTPIHARSQVRVQSRRTCRASGPCQYVQGMLKRTFTPILASHRHKSTRRADGSCQTPTSTYKPPCTLTPSIKGNRERHLGRNCATHRPPEVRRGQGADHETKTANRETRALTRTHAYTHKNPRC